jgi:hypothetical protein
MSLLRIATTNLLELASSITGPSSPTTPIIRLADRNIKKTVRVGGASITGGTITTDGAYTVHTFTASGTLVVVSDTPIDASVLVVGGGGGGGAYVGGGGGAGGLIESTQALSGAMPVVVGNGGEPGDYSTSVAAGDGGASAFGAYAANGGGAGATYGNPGKNGNTGGSGGGGGGTNETGRTTTGGAASPSGQGYAGGSNGGFVYPTYPYPSGGGGGAGAVGANGTATTSGAGGAGVASSISGASVQYAGGGGGGVGSGGTAGTASYGGGAGATSGHGAAATSYGGGGGGCGYNYSTRHGGRGGQGVVIIRYLTADLSTSATRAYTFTGGISAESVSALILAAGHNVGGLAYTLAKSANGSSWTTVSNGTLAAGTGTQVIEFAATTGAYWKFSLPDSTDAVLTEIFLTNIYTFTRNPSRPSGALETDYNVEKSETYAGSPRYIDRGDDRRVRDYDFARAPTAMAEQVKSEIDALGGTKDFFLCDHTGVWMFGNLTVPFAPAEATSATRSCKFYFRESA